MFRNTAEKCKNHLAINFKILEIGNNKVMRFTPHCLLSAAPGGNRNLWTGIFDNFSCHKYLFEYFATFDKKERDTTNIDNPFSPNIIHNQMGIDEYLGLLDHFPAG